MNKRNLFHKNSIGRRLLIPLIFIVLLQAVVFLFAIFGVRSVQQLKTNSYTMFHDKVESRKKNLENEMLQRWSNKNLYVNLIQECETIYQKSLTTRQLTMSSKLMDSLLSLLGNSSATGAYVIFDQKLKDSNSYPAIYIRDLDPRTASVNNQDIQAEFGPADLAKGAGLSLDRYWRADIPLNSEEDTYHFYFKPRNAANATNDGKSSDFGYWSSHFQIEGDAYPVLTYSMPLLDKNHQTYAVVGIEITMDYLRNQLPYSELPLHQKSTYVFGYLDKNTNALHPILINGPTYQKELEQATTLEFADDGLPDGIKTAGNIGKKNSVLCATSQFKLYDANTPFNNEVWCITGLVDAEQLTDSAANLVTSLWYAFLAALLIGILGTLAITFFFAKPIYTLAQELLTSDPSKPILLPQTQIMEIDELTEAIQNLSRNVAYSASRLAQILESVNIQIGAIEIDLITSQVFCTNKVAMLLGLENPTLPESISIPEFEQIFRVFSASALVYHSEYGKEDNDYYNNNTYELSSASGPRWLSFKTINNENKTLIVLSDVTNEVLEKKKIEYDRDFDLLTSLLNRRAFQRQVEPILTEHLTPLGAMIMWDLDNLKYINDTYGHDIGDRYISESAQVFSTLSNEGGIVSRMSGDEFLAFLPSSGRSMDEITLLLQDTHNTLQNTMFHLPDQQVLKLRASCGIAWYPQDADQYELLCKRADYAMYNTKNSMKGGVTYFNMEAYKRDELLFSGREDLNRFIDDRLVDYAFQPIVDARTGDVFAYEALMRPQMESLRTPLDVMRLARAQSKLYQIETLTWNAVLEAYHSKYDSFHGAKIFINSIPNTRIQPEDMARLEAEYAKELPNLVIEIIESEQTDAECMEFKRSLMQVWNCEMALDDFGAGYSTESSLLSIAPKYVKIDKDIIHNVDSDENRQKLVSNILSYTSPRNMKVIAEGVETREELTALQELGVDYIQGFYLARPAFDIRGIPSEKIMELRTLHKQFHSQLSK